MTTLRMPTMSKSSLASHTKDRSSDSEETASTELVEAGLMTDVINQLNQPAIGRQGEPFGPTGAGLIQWKSAGEFLKGVTKFDTPDDAWRNGLWWTHLIFAAMYFISGITMLFIAIFWTKQNVETYWTPQNYNKGANTWQISLDFVAALRIDFLLFAIHLGFAMYHAVHLIGPLRAWYNNSVIMWQFSADVGPSGYAYNYLRWAMHGVVGGGIIASGSLIVGSMGIFNFVAVWLVYGLFCSFMLLMEMYNPHWYAGSKRRIVNWTAYAQGVLAILFVAAVYTTHFAWIVNDKASKVGWYVYAVYALVALATIAELAINGLYWMVTFIKKFVYVEVLHLFIEFALFFGVPWLIIIGFGTV